MRRKFTQAEVDSILAASNGKFYCNTQDTNLFVKVVRPARIAIIPNWGNPWAWVCFAAAGAVIFAISSVL